MVVKIKEYPRIAALIKRALPSYRKHSVIVSEYSKVTCHGGAWSGGSRSHYSKCRIDGSCHNSIAVPTAPKHFGGGDDPVVELTDDIVVLSGGIFRGKTATVSIYCNSTVAEYLLGAGQ